MNDPKFKYIKRTDHGHIIEIENIKGNVLIPSEYYNYTEYVGVECGVGEEAGLILLSNIGQNIHLFSISEDKKIIGVVVKNNKQIKSLTGTKYTLIFATSGEGVNTLYGIRYNSKKKRTGNGNLEIDYTKEFGIYLPDHDAVRMYNPDVSYVLGVENRITSDGNILPYQQQQINFVESDIHIEDIRMYVNVIDPDYGIVDGYDITGHPTPMRVFVEKEINSVQGTCTIKFFVKHKGKVYGLEANGDCQNTYRLKRI